MVSGASPQGLGASPAQRIRNALTGPEWRRVAALLLFIALLHAIGFFMLFALIVPNHYALGGGGVFGVGVGITAYTLGMRHAFDVDHIAAIDNTTRKLMSNGQRPLSVGFYFALGHASVVFLLAGLLGIGIRGLSGDVSSDGSTLHDVTGVIGPSISGTFLVIIGVINLVVLAGILQVFRQMRRGHFDEEVLEEQLSNRGFMNRILRRASSSITHPWQMYPLGFLFGLGFDTATEIALLASAGTAAASGLPFYAILTLPILFAAGMSLLDTIDGAFMNFAYGWALSKPVRKVYYNITITGLSVIVALVVGSIEVCQVISDRLNLTGGFWTWCNNLDFNTIGYCVVAMFVATWAIAVSVWRFGRIEERWTANLQPSEPAA
jgi:high-affinity nickel-transport protein